MFYCVLEEGDVYFYSVIRTTDEPMKSTEVEVKNWRVCRNLGGRRITPWRLGEGSLGEPFILFGTR
jgi:hypothetical protein